MGVDDTDDGDGSESRKHKRDACRKWHQRSWSSGDCFWSRFTVSHLFSFIYLSHLTYHPLSRLSFPHHLLTFRHSNVLSIIYKGLFLHFFLLVVWFLSKVHVNKWPVGKEISIIVVKKFKTTNTNLRGIFWSWKKIFIKQTNEWQVSLCGTFGVSSFVSVALYLECNKHSPLSLPRHLIYLINSSLHPLLLLINVYVLSLNETQCWLDD